MQQLNFPDYTFKILNEGENLLIFDELRKKYLVLTPEEWVRQNLIRYLIEEKKFPKGLISLEAGLKVNTLQRRYDALVYSKDKRPLVLIECKAPSVNINEKVFDQILAYNATIKASYLIVSNGLKHYCLKKNDSNKFKFENSIPFYNELTLNP